MGKLSTILLFFITIMVFFVSCSPTKHLTNGQLFLKKNNLRLVDSVQVYPFTRILSGKSTEKDTAERLRKTTAAPSKSIGITNITQAIENRNELKSNLELFIRQKRNTHLLFFFPLDLWIYELSYSKKDKGLTWWIRTHVGEAPVLVDSAQTLNSTQLMKAFLQSKGYLIPTVSFNTRVKNRKAWVTYIVKPGFNYTYDTIRYISDNPDLFSTLVGAESQGSLIKRNGNFDAGILDKERDRITHFFRDKGYFKFNKNMLYFEWDTLPYTHKVNLTLHLVQMADSLSQTRYLIQRINVYPKYLLSLDSTKNHYKYEELYKNLHIFSDSGQRFVKPFVLRENIYTDKGKLFNQTLADNTIKQLNGIGIFKFVTAHYDLDDSGRLVITYFLTPYQRHLYQADFDLYNTQESPIGMGVKLSYKNRNLSRIGLQLLADVTTGVELTNFKYYKNETKNDYRIGVINISPKLSLYWPRFVAIPGLNFLSSLFPQNDYPHTIYSVGYTYDERVKYFTLQSLNMAFGYEEDLSPRTHILWNLITVSYSRAGQFDSTFYNKTVKLNPVLERSLTFRFIQGSSFTYQHNNQSHQEQKKYYFFKANFEADGNVLRLFSGLANDKLNIFTKEFYDTSRYYSLNKTGTLHFAQFLRADADFRQYFNLNKRNLIVLRLAPGLGFAYGNSSFLPYIREFFLGGASGLRGWQVYGLGPGQYHPGATQGILYDQTGDAKLEGNAEYRFSFIGRLKGALFADAGNIWNIRRDPSRPEGQLNAQNFVIGLDGGIGLRIDFTFFIFRLDMATPIFDPTQYTGSRWIETFKPLNSNWLGSHTVFNFAIGYPF